MSGVIDAAVRAAAVDPGASFCVSAPAGSGKTELLIQRYLSLLSRVQRPEQVLAITFTRKAAAEMRERVMNALRAARTGEPCYSRHQQITRTVAKQALSADLRGAWHLDRDVSRFNIKTIDSFCAGLTRQMPVLSQFGGQAAVQNEPDQLYAEAVLELYKLLDEDHAVSADLAALMLHFDNNWERLQGLLVSMLARREQWRGYVGVHYEPEVSEAYMVEAVNALVRDALTELSELLTPFRDELLELLQFSAANIGMHIPAVFPGIDPADLRVWSLLRHMLLTRTGGWRRTLSKKEGFPPGKGEPEQRKGQMKDMLSRLQAIEGLQAGLVSILRLPIIAAGSASWQLVLHLSRLLPVLAAQLLLIFQRHGVVDHSQVAQSALLALGEDDAPTELALRLDYRIEHILVDEFQDTAVNQYELLHKLTRGWGEYNAEHPGAPRTLMIVGDGMQSIYSFRGANVGLFLKARREGFNGVALKHLELRCNFRSDKGVVDWVNQTFSQAFPDRDDAQRSQIGYSPATPVRSAENKPPVEMHAFHGSQARTQEVAFICRQIASYVGQDGGVIAVLGRSRGHLQPIINHLKHLQVSYYAPELDSLAHSPVVADLINLCRALANDADRLAWMALLRAPWCGLQLADLLSVASLVESLSCGSVWNGLLSSEIFDALSTDGRKRLQQILPPLQRARDKRDRLGLRVWIEQAWLGLNGPRCAPGADGLQDAESFLQLLEQAEAEGVGLDTEWLSLRLQKRYMSAGDPDSRVHLMTLHKAKGLEFDRVIISQLDKVTRSDQRNILLWDEHINSDGTRTFLLAADDHCADDAPTIYNYLVARHREKTLLETTRLLYVGATRAVSHLLLTCCSSWDEKTGQFREPSRRSLLSPVWQTFQQQMTIHEPAGTREVASVGLPARPLVRLQCDTSLHTAAAPPVIPPRVSNPEYPQPGNFVERCIGVVVHKALEQLPLRPQLPSMIDDQDRMRLRVALQGAGLWGEALEEALDDTLNSLVQSLRADGSGRWVLDPAHAAAHNEWTLSTLDDRGQIRDIVIDRSFIDRSTGVRWIIDYKNSRPGPGELLQGFIDRECGDHREQLRRYRDAVRNLGMEPLRCALFFTRLGNLVTLAELDLPGLEA